MKNKMESVALKKHEHRKGPWDKLKDGQWRKYNGDEHILNILHM